MALVKWYLGAPLRGEAPGWIPMGARDGPRWGHEMGGGGILCRPGPPIASKRP